MSLPGQGHDGILHTGVAPSRGRGWGTNSADPTGDRTAVVQRLLGRGRPALGVGAPVQSLPGRPRPTARRRRGTKGKGVALSQAKRHGFSDHDLQVYALEIPPRWLGDHLDAFTAQKLATRALAAQERVAFGQAGSREGTHWTVWRASPTPAASAGGTAPWSGRDSLCPPWSLAMIPWSRTASPAG